MSKKTVAGDDRVKVLDAAQLDRWEWTIRNEGDGTDAAWYPSETEERDGAFPLPAGGEIVVHQDDDWFSGKPSDGLWVETVGSVATTLKVFQAAVERNQRREMERPNDASARRGDRDTVRTGKTVAAGNTAAITLYDNAGNPRRVAERVTVHISGNGAGNTATSDVLFIVTSSDSDANTVEEMTTNGPDGQFENLTIPPDGNVNVYCENFSGSEVGFGAAVSHRRAN